MSTLRESLKRNLGYKLLALGFSISLAISVYHQPVQEFVVEIGVNLSGLPENQIFVGDTPAQLVVRLQGPESELLDLARRSSSVRYDIDLSAATDADELLFDPQRIEELLRVHRVRVAGIRPRQLKVQIERKLEREIPVNIQFVGTPREGFRHAQRNSQVLPSTIVVTGPESEVAKVHSIRTKPVQLDGLDHAVQFEQPLVRPHGGHLRLSLSKVRIEVAIEEELRGRKLEAVLTLEGCPKGHLCTVHPEKVWLIAHGRFRAMERLEKEPPTKVSVLIPASASAGTLRLETVIQKTIEEVHVQVEPATVEVRIKERGPSGPPSPATDASTDSQGPR